jgi:hypothetical protein
LTGQIPQWAVVSVEEEKEEDRCWLVFMAEPCFGGMEVKDYTTDEEDHTVLTRTFSVEAGR